MENITILSVLIALLIIAFFLLFMSVKASRRNIESSNVESIISMARTVMMNSYLYISINRGDLKKAEQTMKRQVSLYISISELKDCHVKFYFDNQEEFTKCNYELYLDGRLIDKASEEVKINYAKM